MKLAELIHLCHIAGKSGYIEFERSTIKGYVFLDRGEIVDACFGDHNAEEAFYIMLESSEGNPDFKDSDSLPPRSIHQPCDYLLMEAARRADEKTKPKKAKPSQATCASLILLSEQSERIFSLSKHKTTIGRLPHNDISLTNQMTSSTHCIIDLKDEEYILSDYESLNGTFVNGVRIRGSVPLKNSDMVQVGATLLKFSLEVRSSKEPLPAPNPPATQLKETGKLELPPFQPPSSVKSKSQPNPNL